MSNLEDNRAGRASPHMGGGDVARSLHRIESAPEGPDGDGVRADERARLAWRPAWAIRSRKGALAALLEMFSKR